MAVDFEVEDGPTIKATAPQWNLSLGISVMHCVLNAAPVNVPAIDTALASGIPLFNSGIVQKALTISGACTLIVQKQKANSLSSGDLLKKIVQEYDFGFVQSVLSHDVLLEYWGRTKDDGRTFRHFDAPHDLHVDTSIQTTPWTRVAGSRSTIVDITGIGGSDIFVYRVFAEMDDHPIYLFPSRVAFQHPVKGRIPHILRKATTRRDFRTIFSYREKAAGKPLISICTLPWTVTHGHTVNYEEAAGAFSTSITSGVPAHHPTSGTASDVSQGDNKLLKAATGSGPFMTPKAVEDWLNDSSRLTVTTEPENEDFKSDFYQFK